MNTKFKRLAQTFTIDNCPDEIVLFDKNTKTIWYIYIDNIYIDNIHADGKPNDIIEGHISYYDIENQEFVVDDGTFSWTEDELNNYVKIYGEIVYIK